MLVFLVGPSKAGKSTLLNHLKRRIPALRVEHLDEIENQEQARLKRNDGWNGRWSRNAAFLETLEVEDSSSHPELIVVDVGAGDLQTDESIDYFLRHADTTILVEAPFETILERHPGRNAAELRRTEFSTRHERLYAPLQADGRVVNTADHSVSQSVAKLLDLIEAIRATRRRTD